MTDAVKPFISTQTKWGGAITGGQYGYQFVPDGLLRHQIELGLNPTDVLVLLNICMHWWESDPDKWPHPRPITIAKRMGTSTRTVERRIANMCKLGLIEWMAAESPGKGVSIRRFKLDGLVAKLAAIAQGLNFSQEEAA
jgi:hypothetical protein